MSAAQRYLSTNKHSPPKKLAIGSFTVEVMRVLLCIYVTISTVAAFAAEQSNVIVLRPEGDYFKRVVDGISDGLEDEIELVDTIIKDELDDKQVHKILDSMSPNGIILMDNLGVLSYKRYQKNAKNTEFPPSIIIATLFAERVIKSIKNSTAILYEIPALTSLSDLRSAVKPIKKAGVLYRENLQHVFEMNQHLAYIENIELIGISVRSNSSKRQVDKGVKKLLRQKPDVLWIMNDGNLLTPTLIKNVWIKRLKKYRSPVVVGVESLIQSQLKFGDYAVSPDHYDLGQQASDLLLDLMDNDWVLNGSLVEPQKPISIKKSINLKLLKNKKIDVPEQSIDEFDRVFIN